MFRQLGKYHGYWCHCSLFSPDHQQPWYWICRINRSLSSRRKDLNHKFQHNKRYDFILLNQDKISAHTAINTNGIKCNYLIIENILSSHILGTLTFSTSMLSFTPILHRSVYSCHAPVWTWSWDWQNEKPVLYCVLECEIDTASAGITGFSI